MRTALIGTGMAHLRVVVGLLPGEARMKGLLASWNIDVSLAASGQEGMGSLIAAAGAGRPFDVAILDMNMPVMDGMELARRILAEPATAGVPLLMLTSSGDSDEAKVARNAGLSAYLTKPVRPERLHQCLGTMVAPHEKSQVADVVAEEILVQTAKPSRGLLLLVEDEPVNRTVAVAMLERGGFQVDSVANGLEAVTAAGTSATTPCSWTARCRRWTDTKPPVSFEPRRASDAGSRSLP